MELLCWSGYWSNTLKVTSVKSMDETAVLVRELENTLKVTSVKSIDHTAVLVRVLEQHPHRHISEEYR